MTHLSWRRFLVLLGFMLCVSAAHADLPPLLPMTDFFKNPEQAAFHLSTTGDYLAYMKPYQSRLNIFVRKIGTSDEHRITSIATRDIGSFDWVNNERIIYLLDKNGDENYHVYSIKRDGTGLIDLTPFDRVKGGITAVVRDDPKHVLLSDNHRDEKAFDVYKVDVDTGARELLVQNPGDLSGFLADHKGNIRIAERTDGVNTEFLYRGSPHDEFKTILKTNFRENVGPEFFTFDNRYIYATSNLGRDKAALVKVDPGTGKELAVIYENPRVDVDGAIASHERKKLTGVTFEDDRPRVIFFDDQRAQLQADLEAKLPGVHVVVSDSNRKENRLILRTYSDKTRGDYYYYDVKTKAMNHLASVSPWLEASTMAEMQSLSYHARDGLLINGYLTLPRGIEAKNLPTVLLVHGGPWSRDGWGFDSETQFFANRGYAVLQANYRGSTGYGKKFWEASFGEWGLTMQDDLTDGVQYLVDQGIADPKRVAIYGGSYGGYAVLEGLTKTPDVYAAGVDIVGVANLLTFMNTIPAYWKPYLDEFHEEVGNPNNPGERAKLADASPVNHVDRIVAPLFIAQGAHDPRVNKAESDQMVAALKARGVEVPYMVKADEGHGFHNEENRFAMYRAVEQFLGKYIGGRVGPGDDVLGPLLAAPAPAPELTPELTPAESKPVPKSG